MVGHGVQFIGASYGFESKRDVEQERSGVKSSGGCSGERGHKKDKDHLHPGLN